MRKVVLLFLIATFLSSIFLITGSSEGSPSSFEEWKKKHGIKYSSNFQNMYREKVFLSKVAQIQKHNAEATRTYNMGLNQFSAMTHQEFKEMYLTLDVPRISKKKHVNNDVYLGDIDWVEKGGVTPIKNQGQCGSCWAFSTTGSLEGLSLLSTGDLRTFSEQQLVDCSGPYGNHGCTGGLMENAFKYIIDKGIMVEDDYPYTARDEKCQRDGGKFKITGYVNLDTCNDLANNLLTRPVSVAVDAEKWDMYESGIFANCSDDLDHGVTLVGMTDKYWKIKNSWGFSWGEKGYIRLARGNTCGVCEMNSFPTR